MRVFSSTETLQSRTTNAGEILYVMGWLTAIIMWGFGLVWLFFAVASITRSKFPFNMGWWGFVFPLGVYTLSTTQMAIEMPSKFFKVLGMVSQNRLYQRDMEDHKYWLQQIFSVAIVLLWIVVSIGTIQRVATGELFFAPCLKELDGKKAEAEKNCPSECPV